MPRSKPPEKLAKGEWLEIPFDRKKFLERRGVVADVVRADRVTGKLDAEKQDRMIADLATAVGLAYEIDLRKLPLVRHDENGEPVRDESGREMRPKLEPFKVHLLARDVLTAWEDAKLDTAIYDNANGQSPVVVFATTLAHAVGIATDNKSLMGNLRKARDFVVTKL